MGGGLLAMAALPSAVEAARDGVQSSEGLSDAQIMLRVKAGDDSAFEYLVQKLSLIHI